MADNNNPSKKRHHGGTNPDPALLELAGRVVAVMAMAPAIIDKDSLRTLLQPPNPLRTLQQVATVFGRSTNTVSRAWRSTGMPGEAGAFDVVEILAWHLEREAKNRARVVAAGHDPEALRELAAIELQTARAELSYRQSRAARASGDYINLYIVASYQSALAHRLRDKVMQIPDDVALQLCPRGRRDGREEVDRICRHALQAFHDELPSVIEDAQKYHVESGNCNKGYER